VTGKLARREGAALAFIKAEQPQHLASLGIERHDVAPRNRGGIEPAADQQRRGFRLIFGARSQRIRLEAPGDF
jgi:hypothetical protein